MLYGKKITKERTDKKYVRHKKIEEKWQNYWIEHNTFEAKTGSKKEPYYILVEFPYPSGAGLHVGHVRVIRPKMQSLE